jgi:hypothetical protein
VIAPDGTVTTLAANPVSMSNASAPATGGTLVLAEPYGGWTATLNGRALRPTATPVGGWAQGFALPAGGGKLSISRNDLAREASLLAELIVALAVCMLALPGKRADPAEQAEAMAALRAARDARRAPGGSRRFARGAARPDVAGVGAGLADDGLADDDLAAAEAATADPAGRGRMRRPGAAIASLGSTRLAITRRRGGRRKADGQDDFRQDDFRQDDFRQDDFRQDDFGQEDFGQDDFGQRELPETVPAAEWPVGATAGGHGGAGLAAQDLAGDGDRRQAPWDMVGDWDSAGRRESADPWADSVQRDAPVQRDGSDQRDATGQWDRMAPTTDRRTATGPQAMPTRPTGQQPAAPAEAAPWESGSWESGSWGTGQQPLPSGTGPQRSPRWQDSGHRAGLPTGWDRDTGEWERAARAEKPAYLGEPAHPAEDDYPAGPADGSGPWPADGSGPWPTASAVPGGPRMTGSAGRAGATGATGAGKPERHSHRASKHGRPSRRRGSADRPGRDGES